MKRYLVWVCAGLLVVSGAVFAEEGDESVFTSEEAKAVRKEVSAMEITDRDTDGRLSYEEYRNQMVKVFVELDSEGDGALVDEELAKFAIEPHHELADRDESGDVSPDEFIGYVTILFAVVDADRDGYLTEGEFHAAGGEEVME